MHSFPIGVTAPIFNTLYKDKNFLLYTESEKKVFDIFGQHRLILSDKIIEYYKKELGNAELIDTFITSFGYQENRIEYVSLEQVCSSGLEELLIVVSKTDMNVLLGDRKDIKPYSGKGVNIVSPSAIVNGADTFHFERVLFPCAFRAESCELCENYSKWFKTLFKNERKIVIIDRYALYDEGFKSLKKYYLPNIENTTDIEIYCSKERRDSMDILKTKANDSVFDKHRVKIFYCEKMEHDRYIVLPNYYVSIGAGICFLQESGRVKPCVVSVQWKQGNKAPNTPPITRRIR